jgi:hypothetical protein
VLGGALVKFLNNFVTFQRFISNIRNSIKKTYKNIYYNNHSYNIFTKNCMAELKIGEKLCFNYMSESLNCSILSSSPQAGVETVDLGRRVQQKLIWRTRPRGQDLQLLGGRCQLPKNMKF